MRMKDCKINLNEIQTVNEKIFGEYIVEIKFLPD